MNLFKMADFKKSFDAPLFMVAQLPFNVEEATKLNQPMTDIMNDEGNLDVFKKNMDQLQIHNSLLEENTSFLEIGCGRGYVLNYLYENGKGNYYGIEPIASEYQKTVDKLSLKSDKNIKQFIHNNLLEEVEFQKFNFDFIYSYHIFEHLENPLYMLKIGHKWLKTNGVMIITCPNVEGYIPMKNLKEWRCSIPSHRWLPGISTIKRAIEENGYTIVNQFTYGGYPLPRNWSQNLSNWIMKKLNKGDVMTLMIKKTH